jgi:homoserine O-acetyltransferase/O-succinyltransferase
MDYFEYSTPVLLENGQQLPSVTIAYHTYGRLNDARDNVIWICHALTANSDAQSWWPAMVGKGLVFDTSKYFIVCANILGSCYGTTGPLSINPATKAPWFHQFPQITIRDMVQLHSLLCRSLGIRKIHLLAGGSMGGYQAIEWCLMEPQLIQRLFLIATAARETAWGIAIHTAQRLAIEADSSWGEPSVSAGEKGLKAARAIGMLTYRSYQTYLATQTDEDNERLDNFRAESYIQYQGSKLVKRFNAYSYWLLTKAMDSHNIARGRNKDITKVLQTIKQKTLVMGISTDMLCPLPEQKLMAKSIPDAAFHELSSIYAHDGFLTETTSISLKLHAWLEGESIRI